jgi:ADP-heptose:LPS heptosyltransferase
LAYLLWTGRRILAAKGDPAEHRVRQLGGLFDLDPPPAPQLWFGPQHIEAAAKLVPPGERFLAIGPAANWRGKEWRAEYFAELATRLTSAQGPFPGARIAVLAAAHERSQAQPMIDALPRGNAIDLVGRTDLLTAGAVLKRAALYVGNDTGLTHIAAASGAPTLALFGPSPVSKYAPWGNRADIAVTALRPDEMVYPGWNHITTDTLMDSLSVEAAEQGAARLLVRIATDEA